MKCRELSKMRLKLALLKKNCRNYRFSEPGDYETESLPPLNLGSSQVLDLTNSDRFRGLQ
jgi:hypothetical protein